jgi:hypothetical protein
VTERTVRRWAEEPDFRAELSRRNGERLAELSRRLGAVTHEAVDVLSGVMDGSIVNGANIRRLAAVSVLELSLKISERQELENRLGEVERRLGL